VNLYEGIQTGSGAMSAPEWEVTAQVARELGIADSILHHWCKALAQQGAQAFPGSGHQTAQEEELPRLKRELEVTRQEHAILNKALAIFSRAQS
jgi:transposase